MFFNHNKETCMEREISEQPEILRKIIETSIDNERNIIFDIPADANKFILVASGSSYNSARFAADFFGNTANIEARAIYSSEFLLKSAVPYAENLLYIFITQSGETSDTNKALKKAKKFGVRTLCITNKKNSTIWNESDFKVDCSAGEEKSIAATKSLTAQMLCLTLIVLKYAKIKGIDISDYLDDLTRLPECVTGTLNLRHKIKKLAKFTVKYKNTVITADGISYAIAREACLKIKETSYLNVTASILGEFMHGHAAILNNKSVLIYINAGTLSTAAEKNLNKLNEEYNSPICIIGRTNNNIKTQYNIDIKEKSEFLKLFAIIILCQMLALETALSLHRNVDKPKGLHKVVI